MRTLILAAVVLILSLSAIPRACGSSGQSPAPPADYLNALRVADLLLAAWAERTPEAGLKLLSARLLAAKPDSSRIDLLSGFPQYLSGHSNPDHEAFEIGPGRPSGPDRIVFPVTLFELYLGESTGYSYSDTLVVTRQGQTWRVDELPRTFHVH